MTIWPLRDHEGLEGTLDLKRADYSFQERQTTVSISFSHYEGGIKTFNVNSEYTNEVRMVFMVVLETMDLALCHNNYFLLLQA